MADSQWFTQSNLLLCQHIVLFLQNLGSDTSSNGLANHGKNIPETSLGTSNNCWVLSIFLAIKFQVTTASWAVDSTRLWCSPRQWRHRKQVGYYCRREEPVISGRTKRIVTWRCGLEVASSIINLMRNALQFLFIQFYVLETQVQVENSFENTTSSGEWCRLFDTFKHSCARMISY